MMQDFKKLKVWEKSHILTLAIYKATQDFPKEELYGLTSQMRRSAGSVPMNIAEGAGRFTPADKNRFFVIASGSLSELEYQLILAHDLGYLLPDNFEQFDAEVQEIRRMLIGLIKSLKP